MSTHLPSTDVRRDPDGPGSVGPPLVHHIGYALIMCLVFTATHVLSGASWPWFTPRHGLSPIKTNDEGLRELALNAPSPSYPLMSLEKRVTGVVVASLTIDINGRVVAVDVLESPDASIERAVHTTLWNWTFRPVEVPSKAQLVVANMIFYFHIENGRGVVSSAKELRDRRAEAASHVETTDRLTARLVTEDELSGLDAPVVVDIRSRSAYLVAHRSTSINIPMSELSVRAAAELPRSGTIVIDCFIAQRHSGLCEMAVHVLNSNGFGHVAIINSNN